MRTTGLLFLGAVMAGCGGDDGGTRPAEDAGPGVDAGPQPDSGGRGLAVTFTDTRDALAFVAARDGVDGEWAVVGDTGGVHSFVVHEDVYALAYVCDLPSGANVNFIFARADEVPAPSAACIPPGGTPLVNVGGTVSGLASTDTSTIHVAGRQAMVTAAMPAFMLEVPMGTRDVFATRVAAAPRIDEMIRRTAATLAEGANFDFDFSTEGFALESHTITVLGTGAADMPSTLVIFRNGGGSPFPLGSNTDGTFQTLPEAELREGDLHSVVSTVSTTDTFRSVRHMIRAGMDLTATLPALHPVPTIDAAATTPYLRPRTTLETEGDPDNVTLIYTQRDMAAMTATVWTLSATRGWLSTTSAATLEVPDLSAVTGFETEWGLTPGEVRWQHIQGWSSLGVADAFDVMPAFESLVGAEYRSTQRLGTATL